MIRSRCVSLLTSTYLELSRNPRLIFKDGFEVRLTGKWVSDHGAQGDDGNPFVLTHFLIIVRETKLWPPSYCTF